MGDAPGQEIRFVLVVHVGIWSSIEPHGEFDVGVVNPRHVAIGPDSQVHPAAFSLRIGQAVKHKFADTIRFQGVPVAVVIVADPGPCSDGVGAEGIRNLFFKIGEDRVEILVECGTGGMLGQNVEPGGEYLLVNGPAIGVVVRFCRSENSRQRVDAASRQQHQQQVDGGQPQPFAKQVFRPAERLGEREVNPTGIDVAIEASAAEEYGHEAEQKAGAPKGPGEKKLNSVGQPLARIEEQRQDRQREDDQNRQDERHTHADGFIDDGPGDGDRSWSGEDPANRRQSEQESKAHRSNAADRERRNDPTVACQKPYDDDGGHGPCSFRGGQAMDGGGLKSTERKPNRYERSSQLQAERESGRDPCRDCFGGEAAAEEEGQVDRSGSQGSPVQARSCEPVHRLKNPAQQGRRCHQSDHEGRGCRPLGGQQPRGREPCQGDAAKHRSKNRWGMPARSTARGCIGTWRRPSAANVVEVGFGDGVAV